MRLYARIVGRRVKLKGQRINGNASNPTMHAIECPPGDAMRRGDESLEHRAARTCIRTCMRRVRPIARFYTSYLRNARKTARPVWHARPTSLVPILRYHPVFALRAGCGGRDKHAKEPRERRKFTRKFTRPVSLGSVAFAAPVLFLGPSSGRHHGMPFFGFLFFFHPGSVWMAPPRLSCRSIDLSWTPSA